LFSFSKCIEGSIMNSLTDGGKRSMRTLRLGMGQINPTVGDLEGNTRKIIRYIHDAKEMGVDLLTFPELAIPGYPPEDLLLMPRFVDANLEYLQKVIRAAESITVLVGFADRKDDIYNAAALIHAGKLEAVYHKMHLPNYGVFDERRYFQTGRECLVFSLRGITVGVNICEDIWYPGNPTRAQALHGGAEIIVNISSSPYHAGKGSFRERMLATRASDNLVIVAFNNLVGGQDELVFDGESMVFDQSGNLLHRGKKFQEELILVDLDVEGVFRKRLHDPRRRVGKLEDRGEREPLHMVHLPGNHRARKKRPRISQTSHQPPHLIEESYQALVLGTRDYVRKNGFKKVVIGLSGGIDSSLVSTIAVDALGSANVIGVFMPSRYTSRQSREDAERLAENLKIKLITVPITETFTAYRKMLASEFAGKKVDVTEENIQARIRGNILMALSNKFTWLVLTTGNKSETSMGYCTLYGDMAGGFAVIKDVPKTLVYELARYRNGRGKAKIIPERVIQKEPSAELRPGQRDTDSLPPYPVLDPILQAYVEEDSDLEGILALGFERGMAKNVIDRVDRNEYKRRQSPPGIKITPRALGKDRRLPITNRYRNY
jgi:NAD+ synthase (glutamine-hydrolysing)